VVIAASMVVLGSFVRPSTHLDGELFFQQVFNDLD